MRNNIIIKGSSHAIGIGLDLELSKRYNDENWLIENGVILPPPRYKEDWENINRTRWPKIVCDKLGVNEYDFKDVPHLNHVPIEQFIIKLALTPPEVLEQKVSHIIYEPQSTRLFYQDMQFTPQEMLDIVMDAKVPEKDKKFIYDWIDNYENHNDLGLKIIKQAMELHKNIEFIFYMFYGVGGELDIIQNYKEIEDRVVEFNINGESSTNLHDLLEKNKLRVCDTAYCYINRIDEFGNEKWKIYPHEDRHAGVAAQPIIADNIIRYIKQTM